MFKNQFLLALLFLLYSTAQYGQYTDEINSNRPGKSMGAFAVGQTIFQTEWGLSYIDEKNHDNDFNAQAWSSDLEMRYGAFFEQLELNANVNYYNESYSFPGGDGHQAALRRVTLGLKYMIYDPEMNYEPKPNLYSWKANHKFNWRQFIPAVGIYGGLHFNLAKEKFLRTGMWKENGIATKGMLITQHQFGKYSFVTNFILDQFPSQRNSFDYILTVTRGFNMRMSGMFEIQGINGENFRENYMRIGAAYLLKKNIQIDASVGSNLQYAPKIMYANVGFSWRFEGQYSDFMLRIPKDKKEGKSKMDKKFEKEKDKQKEKKKKRMDAVESGEKAN
ncbi:transporter [Flavobacterium sp. CYK-55]|uniref:transporter n=1 Tax=Flavobacterium sp. CYK-55 TaxID=2835529 RepID=UPI001BCB4CFF|nr:transporter [Flavobacterium sp. CYK-55]MBS7787058.1 transporter [Flavobacterium sp. CYK-55]